MKGKAHRGLNIVDYIIAYYTLDTNKVGTPLTIKEITSLPIKIILFTIARIAGSASLH